MKNLKFTFIALLIISPELYSQTEVSDTDNDTKVQTEALSDEDKIRFTLGGVEHFRMDGYHLLFLNNQRSIFIGQGAGDGDDGTDNQNTAIGHNAMSGSTLSGFQNVAFGEATLLALSSGERNTVLGQSAMRRLTTGSYNTAVGEDALYSDVSGNNNTAIGRNAGFNVLGDGGVYIGYQAGYNELGSNKLYIDNSNTSSPLIYGEFDNDLVIINGTYEVTSDKRLKSDIVNVDNALSKVTSLNGYKYKRKNKADADRFEIGVIAQEVQQYMPDLVGQNREGMLSVNYSGLTTMLLEALKEQQDKILQLEERLGALEAK